MNYFAVLDMSQHVELYEAVLQMVAALTLATCPSPEGDRISAMLSEHEGTISLTCMLRRLYDCIVAYLLKLDLDRDDQKSR